MTGPLLAFSTLLVIAQFALPRRLAFLPLLIAACHAPYQAALGGNFTAVRLVIIAGLIRAVGAGVFRLSWSSRLDRLLILWSVLALISAFGHETGTPFIYRSGLVLNVLGTYLYTRAFIPRIENVQLVLRSLIVVLIPLAALLMWEAISGQNAYAPFGTRRILAVVREDRARAAGPFGTPILAGTVGAICFPLMFALWRTHRTQAKIGMITCIVIVMASASSTPIGSLIVGVGALYLWRWRRDLRLIQIGAVVLLFILSLLSNRPLWYQIARIDFVGGSTGYHRARLLDQAFKHLNEWWLIGTDYTRHWMPYGLPTDPNHTDITSYYVHLGVIGGLPLMLCLIAIFWKCFVMLGRRIRQLRKERDPQEFFLWCVGCSLFSHAITCLTISYFDQLLVFFYMTVGVVPILAARRAAVVRQPAPVRARSSGWHPSPTAQKI
jgi:hypothetical protein